MNKEAKELGKWYLKLAENDNGATYFSGTGEWKNCKNADLPTIESYLPSYKINPPKPIERWMWVSADGELLSNFFSNYEEGKKFMPRPCYGDRFIKLREVIDES